MPKQTGARTATSWKPIASLLLFVPALIQITALQAQSQKGVIAGQIRAQIGVSAGIRIAAVGVNDASGALVSIAVTDAAGRYRLEEIPPGEYRIIAGAVASPLYYPGTANADVAKTVSVAAGATITGIDFAACAWRESKSDSSAIGGRLTMRMLG